MIHTGINKVEEEEVEDEVEAEETLRSNSNSRMEKSWLPVIVVVEVKWVEVEVVEEVEAKDSLETKICRNIRQ